MVDVRSKGRRNEHLVKGLYLDEMGVKLQVDLDQYRSADRGDLVPAGVFAWPFCIEVKSRAKVNYMHDKSWSDQVLKAAKANRKIPVLWYKYDRREWRVVMQLADVALALAPASVDGNYHGDLLTMSPSTHFYLAREILAEMAPI